jgi:hypothetical protein
MRAQAEGGDSEPTYSDSDAAKARREDRKLARRSRAILWVLPKPGRFQKVAQRRGGRPGGVQILGLQARTGDAAAKLRKLPICKRRLAKDLENQAMVPVICDKVN